MWIVVFTNTSLSLRQLKTGIVESGLDVLQRMQDSGKRMVVFYGSQTGTAEEFTTRLCKEARYYGISAMCADPVEYDIVSKPPSLLKRQTTPK